MTWLLVVVLAVIAIVTPASNRRPLPISRPPRHPATVISVDNRRAEPRAPRRAKWLVPGWNWSVASVTWPPAGGTPPFGSAGPYDYLTASSAHSRICDETLRCDWCQSVASACSSVTPGSARFPQTLDNRAESARLPTPLTPPVTVSPLTNPIFRNHIRRNDARNAILSRPDHMSSTRGHVWSFPDRLRTLTAVVSTTYASSSARPDFRNRL
jgi:hypothetical protein